MKRIAVLLFLSLSFAAWSEEAKTEPLSADDEKLAASLLALLTDNDFDKREQAEKQLKTIVLLDAKKAAAWDTWIADAKKGMTDREILTRLPSNVALRFNLCGRFKGIVGRAEIGLEIEISPDGSYKLFSYKERVGPVHSGPGQDEESPAKEREDRGHGVYAVQNDGSAVLKGTATGFHQGGGDEWQCTVKLVDDRLVTHVKFGISEIDGKWMRITTSAPTAAELRNAIRECGLLDHTLKDAAWETINRLPVKSRLELLQTHLSDADVPVDESYMQNLTTWSADNSRQSEYVSQLAAAITTKAGEAFLQSFLALNQYNSKLPIDDAVKKRFAESLETASEDMGNRVFQAKIDWTALFSDGLNRAIESFISRPFPTDRHKETILQIKAEVLKRYYVLNPVRARQIILEQLRKDNPDFDYSGLSLLPDKELPELTADFRKSLSSRRIYSWTILPCIERYGTAELLPDVIAWYEPKQGRWACALQDAALGFIMKHDRKAGFKYLKEALTHRKETGCYKDAVSHVLHGDQGEDSKTFLVGVLADSEEEVVQSAARLLIEFPDGADILKKKLAENEKAVSKNVSDYFQNLIKGKELKPILIKEKTANPKD